MSIFKRLKRDKGPEKISSKKYAKEPVGVSKADDGDYEDIADYFEEEQEQDMRKQNHVVGRTSGVINPRPTYQYNYYKKIVNKKLTIILLENTQEAVDNKSTILKIIRKLESTDFVGVISYGSKVKANRVCKVYEFDDGKLFDMEDVGNNSCFYDAIKVLEMAVSISSGKLFEEKFEKLKIANIDIIGIGSGKDESSIITREEAMNFLNSILARSNVETKYFCFAEETFIEPAIMGFHSIGAFPKSK